MIIPQGPLKVLVAVKPVDFRLIASSGASTSQKKRTSPPRRKRGL